MNRDVCSAINIMHKAYDAAYGRMHPCFQQTPNVPPWRRREAGGCDLMSGVLGEGRGGGWGGVLSFKGGSLIPPPNPPRRTTCECCATPPRVLQHSY